MAAISDMTAKSQFIKNSWYVAAWSHDIDENAFLARTLQNEQAESPQVAPSVE
jgi:hypothetical protein